MPRAIWKGTVIADSPKTVQVEGNYYFPPDSVHREFLMPSETHTTCPWKGKASYFHVNVNGEQNKDAAWYYPEPSAAAGEIKHHIAFWRGVRVEA
jgi:uncharacterized protein (DUF427 family)